MYDMIIIWLYYPMVNKQLDPENDQFSLETSLPTPMTARVYVNLPEGMIWYDMIWCDVIWYDYTIYDYIMIWYDMGSSDTWVAQNPVVHYADHHFPRNGVWARVFCSRVVVGKIWCSTMGWYTIWLWLTVLHGKYGPFLIGKPVNHL